MQADHIAPTPKDTVFTNGTASLYHFRGCADADAAGMPVLLVPSMINRWYVLDLREGASLVRSLVDAGLDVWCLDWGIPNDEDRYLTWEGVIDRLHRFVRQVQRRTGHDKVGMLGYCMGGTLSAIYAALHPDEIATLVSLAAPIDFEQGGLLSHLVDERWFDPEALTEAGNLMPVQMQTGFVTLRPTGQISKWVMLADRWHDDEFVDAFTALETWVGDNIPFPAAAYVTYIRQLYQHNELANGEHYVGGERVDLSKITCPLLTIAASRDTICPPEAAGILNELVGSEETELLTVRGGHVGAVVGSKAPLKLYPAIARWFADRLGYHDRAHAGARSPSAPQGDAAAEPTPHSAPHPQLVELVARALRTDNYNAMRSALSQLDIGPASGTKDQIRGRLQAFLDRAERH